MRSMRLRTSVPALAAVALISLPAPSQNEQGSCQGDVYWAETHYTNPPAGIRRRITDVECVSFGCTSTCQLGSVAGEYVTWKVCRCGATDPLECCTLVWHSSITDFYVAFDTLGTCPPCGESGTCSVKTILVYKSTTDGNTTYFRETVALCSE